MAEVPALTAASELERARLQKWAQAVAERLRLTDQLFTPGGVAAAPPPPAAPPGQVSREAALEALSDLVEAGAKARPAAAAVAKLTGLAANELYRELTRQ